MPNGATEQATLPGLLPQPGGFDPGEALLQADPAENPQPQGYCRFHPRGTGTAVLAERYSVPARARATKKRELMGARGRRQFGYLAASALGLAALLLALPAGAGAEQAASKAHRAAAGRLAAGARFSCAIIRGGAVRCWGINDSGQLGYGNTRDIGDNETPASVAPVDLGGHKAVAIAAGFYHACALLDNGRVRCWGQGSAGQLGYGNTNNVGDDETPAAAGPVELGGKAVAITAGGFHTCAILDNGRVRCWGLNWRGELGVGNTNNIGDYETPASVAPVNLGRKG